MQVISVILFASVFIDSVAGLTGGTIVKSGTKTYVSGLRLTNETNRDNYNFCGAVLITSTHVLSSPSCMSQYPAEFVAVGPHLQVVSKGDGEEIKVVKVTTHPKYNSDLPDYDIAVLKLERPTKFQPIKLAAPTDVKTGMLITAFGWGPTVAGADAKGSAELRRMSQKVISNDVCGKALEFNVQMDQFCAGGDDNTSICDGDGGGPAILENNPNTDSDDVLVGVIIGGGGCAVKKPSIYTNVPYLLDWIKQQTGTSH